VEEWRVFFKKKESIIPQLTNVGISASVSMRNGGIFGGPCLSGFNCIERTREIA